MPFEILIEHLILTFSYLGIFIANLIVSATILIPLPGPLIIVFAYALGLNIFLVSIASAAGSMVGEMVSYYAGFLGNNAAARTVKKYKKIEKLVRKYFSKHAIIIIFLAALLPFPFDIAGIVAGASRYSVIKFLIVGFAGKFFKTVYLFLAIKYGIEIFFASSGFLI